MKFPFVLLLWLCCDYICKGECLFQVYFCVSISCVYVRVHGDDPDSPADALCALSLEAIILHPSRRPWVAARVSSCCSLCSLVWSLFTISHIELEVKRWEMSDAYHHMWSIKTVVAYCQFSLVSSIFGHQTQVQKFTNSFVCCEWFSKSSWTSAWQALCQLHTVNSEGSLFWQYLYESTSSGHSGKKMKHSRMSLTQISDFTKGCRASHSMNALKIKQLWKISGMRQ